MSYTPISLHATSYPSVNVKVNIYVYMFLWGDNLATSYPFENVKCIYICIHVFVGRLINFVKLNASYIHALYV